MHNIVVHDEPAAKRARLSMEDILMELENDDEPMMSGSDDEFEDIVCTEKGRDEWGGIDRNYPPRSADTFTLSDQTIFASGLTATQSGPDSHSTLPSLSLSLVV